VTRAAPQAEALLDDLAARGLDPVAIPTIVIRPVEPGSALDVALLGAADGGWVAVTSANGATAVLDAARRLGRDQSGHRWAAVGPATTSALAARGVRVAFVPTTADAATLAAELPIGAGDEVLLPLSDLANPGLVSALEARGAAVEAVVAYRTEVGPQESRERIRALFAAGDLGAIVFTSGSTVRGLLALLGSTHRRLARRTLAACIGEPTASVARAAGFEHVLVAPSSNASALADLVAAAVLLPIPDPAAEPRQEVPS
jgi:uroporphyrinogen-III synthase